MDLDRTLVGSSRIPQNPICAFSSNGTILASLCFRRVMIGLIRPFPFTGTPAAPARGPAAQRGCCHASKDAQEIGNGQKRTGVQPPAPDTSGGFITAAARLQDRL